MRYSKSISLVVRILFLFSCVFSIGLFAQNQSLSIFGETEKVINSAKEAQADILSPKNFSDAMKYYDEAVIKNQKGKSRSEVEKSLRASLSYLKLALEASKIAEVTFSSTIKGRADALSSDAPNFASSTWLAAEKKFNEAARDLEDGDGKKAKRKSTDAHALYKQSELEAIKANYLSETWNLLEQSKQLNVKSEAPKTLQKANDLIKEAENELNTNRYDTDVARALAQEAKYEAKHAIYLSERVKQIKKNKVSMEELLLTSEEPLRRIAITMDEVAEFDNGTDLPTSQIMEYIKAYQDSVHSLEQLIDEQNAQITEMERILDDHSELKEQLGYVEKMREQFNDVEKLFTVNEARVYRENEDVVIRLTGLKFRSGQSIIQPQDFGLLTNVKRAIEVYPNCHVTVGGHTDSHGSDEANRQLSENRAAAVKQYLLANMNIEPHRLLAIGYGESKPIANNKTYEGREKNRRIEVIIRPETIAMK